MRIRRPGAASTALLLAALLLAQWLGLLHGLVHAPAPSVRAEAHAQAPGQSHAADHTHAAADWAQRLFHSHAAGTLDCQLLDQMAHADVPPAVPALALLEPAPPLLSLALQPRPASGGAAAFHARAPPTFS